MSRQYYASLQPNVKAPYRADIETGSVNQPEIHGSAIGIDWYDLLSDLAIAANPWFCGSALDRSLPGIGVNTGVSHIPKEGARPTMMNRGLAPRTSDIWAVAVRICACLQS
eukprot:1351315-Amorphochlora_amoeboformis.AAC.1